MLAACKTMRLAELKPIQCTFFVCKESVQLLALNFQFPDAGSKLNRIRCFCRYIATREISEKVTIRCSDSTPR
jgi:hypothetical protein